MPAKKVLSFMELLGESSKMMKKIVDAAKVK